MSHSLYIFTISYEGTLFSYEFKIDEGVITPFFNCKDHVGRIKAVHATADGLVLTSGEDENIKVYNYLKRKKLSNIYGTSGVALKLLSTPAFTLSCHENGAICIEGKKDFAIYHRLKVFKDSCIDFDLHPSNKLMVCLNNKQRFAVWNLSMCSVVFHKKIKVQAQMVRFLDDERLIILTPSSIYCFNIRLMTVTNEIKAVEGTKINDCVIIRDPKPLVAIGCENGHVYFYPQENFNESSEDESPLYIGFKAYNYRVKKVAVAGSYMVTVSTEGDISIWDISDIQGAKDLSGGVVIESYSALYEYKVSSRLVGLSCIMKSDHQAYNANGQKASQENTAEAVERAREPRLKHKIQKYRKIRRNLNN